MALSTVDIFSERPDLLLIDDIALAISGSSLMLGLGRFFAGGVEYPVEPETFDWSAGTADADPRGVAGFLAKDKNTNEVVLIVDDRNPGDPAFDFESSDYELLHKAFSLVIPENENNLENCDVTLFRIVEKPEPQPIPANPE